MTKGRLRSNIVPRMIEMADSTAIRCTCVSALLLSLCVIANAAVHGELPELPQNCQDRMSLIFDSYYSEESLASVNCSSVIRTALNDGGSKCPSESVLQACFQVHISGLHVFQNLPTVSYTQSISLSVHRLSGCRHWCTYV